MTVDLSSMNDADLATAIQQAQGQQQPSNILTMSMSNDDLANAIKQAQAANVAAHPVAGPSDSFMTDIGRRLGTGAATAVAGIAALPHLAAEGTDYLGNLATLGTQKPWAVPMLESAPAMRGGYPMFPDFNQAKGQMLHAMGGTEYAPATWWGRRGQDVINGVAGGGLANAAIAGPRAALAMTPAVAGGSATGGATAEMFPDHPLIAAMVGSIPGMALGNAAVNAPQRVSAMMNSAAPASEPYGAFARLGLPTNLSGTTTGEPGLAFAEKFAARMPGSEGAVAEARGNLVSAWQDKMNEVATKMGQATTPQELGTTAQTAASDWLDQFKNQQRADWTAYRSHVPLDTPVEVPGFTQALNNVLGDFGGADNLAKALQPQLAAKLKESLGEDLNGGTTLPSQAVHSVRTALGQMLENPQPIEGIAKSAVKRLYGGLSQDIAGEAAAAGPEAQAAFTKANTATSAGHDILDNYVAPVLQAKTPEQATQFIMGQAKQGGTRLSGVLNNLPTAAGDVRSYALRNAAASTENPTSLATALIGRRPMYSPEAQTALFGDPTIQGQVADLAATGRAMQPFEKDLANSPTATHQTRGLGRLIAASELAKQGHEFFGVPGAVAGGAAGLFAPNILGRAAQATALNPYLAALYGKQLSYQTQNPSLLARTIAAQSLGPRAVPPAVATSASSSALSP